MTRDEDDYRQLRSHSDTGMDEWIDHRFSGPAPMLWWVSIFESNETAVGAAQQISTTTRIERMNFALRTILLAIDRNEIGAWVGSYWLIRMASVGVRTGIAPGELPALLSPDGAANWALEHMPLSRSGAISLARRRNAAIESSRGATKESISRHLEEISRPDHEIYLLADIERVVRALRWIKDAIEDNRLRVEVHAWLDSNEFA